LVPLRREPEPWERHDRAVVEREDDQDHERRVQEHDQEPERDPERAPTAWRDRRVHSVTDRMLRYRPKIASKIATAPSMNTDIAEPSCQSKLAENELWITLPKR